MQKLLILWCCLLGSVSVFSQNTEILFEKTSLEAAKQKAVKEGKVLFIDCMADFCGACRMMEREVFTAPVVAAFFNEHFVSYQLNMDRQEGKEFGKIYDIPAYPTLIFMDERGKIILKEVGGRKVDGFMELAHRALAREKSEAVRFEEGERDKTFVINYLEKCGKAFLKQDVQDAFNKLYQEQGKKLLKDNEYWGVFVKYVEDRECPAALEFIKNYKVYAQLHDRDTAFWKVRKLYANFKSAYDLFENDRNGYPDTKKGVIREKREAYFSFLEERELPDVDELKAQIDFICLTKAGCYEEAFDFGEKHLKRANARTLCEWATLAERTVRKKEVREKMSVWADRALKSAEKDSYRAEAGEMSKRLKMMGMPFFGKHAHNYSLPI